MLYVPVALIKAQLRPGVCKAVVIAMLHASFSGPGICRVATAIVHDATLSEQKCIVDMLLNQCGQIQSIWSWCRQVFDGSGTVRQYPLFAPAVLEHGVDGAFPKRQRITDRGDIRQLR